MIFKAIVIPTPRRIRKYIEDKIDELNTESLTNDESNSKEDEHIDITKDRFKNYGLTTRIF